MMGGVRAPELLPPPCEATVGRTAHYRVCRDLVDGELRVRMNTVSYVDASRVRLPLPEVRLDERGLRVVMPDAVLRPGEWDAYRNMVVALDGELRMLEKEITDVR